MRQTMRRALEWLLAATAITEFVVMVPSPHGNPTSGVFGHHQSITRWRAASDMPPAITISGASVAEQVALLRAREAAGATWAILQPPMVGMYAGAEYIEFVGRVADAARIPVGIQNAPGYMMHRATWAAGSAPLNSSN
ncbi:MAG TPA: hypothetical protein VFW75_07475 [Acetobacteraceae bacterium]|nr:hypothetical protein [Acetobacteraceae bacterium]